MNKKTYSSPKLAKLGTFAQMTMETNMGPVWDVTLPQHAQDPASHQMS